MRQGQLVFSMLLLGLFQASGLAAEFKMPAYQKIKLNNGMQLFLMPQTEVPLLHISIAIQGGSSSDPVALAGLAGITHEALQLGSKTYKKNLIEERLDFLGAELSTTTRPDYSMVELSLASKDSAQLLPVLADIITAPVFPEQEILKLKERTISELKKAKESPNQLADQYFNKLIFNQHPYGRPVYGTILSVSRIKRQDLLQHHKRTFRPEQMAITIAGNMDSTALETQIRSAFEKWSPAPEAGNSSSLAIPDPKRSTESHVLLVNKADASETTFRIGGLGIPRDTPDWAALQVINTILGGRFTSLLNEALRIKSGLTYGARSRFEAFKTSGTFAIASFTANDNSFKAIDLALQTYKQFLQDGIDQKTLDSAKSYVKGQFPPRFETLDSLSTLMAEMWAYQLPDRMINDFTAQVDGLSVARANELVKTYFPAKNLNILLIGKSVELFNGVQKYGRVIQTDMNRIDEADLIH